MLTVAILGTSTARASEGDVALWAGAGIANAGAATDEGPYLGAAAQTGVRFGIADFWSIQFGAEGAHHFPVDRRNTDLGAMQVADLFGGFRLDLDVFSYVPYIGASVVTFVDGPRPRPARAERPAVGGKLSLGVDWRFTRRWSVGLKADLHAIGTSAEGFPGYATAGAVLSYHFHL